MSHKSEMAGPFNRGDTIINKHFTLLYISFSQVLKFVFSINSYSLKTIQCCRALESSDLGL